MVSLAVLEIVDQVNDLFLIYHFLECQKLVHDLVTSLWQAISWYDLHYELLAGETVLHQNVI